MSEETNTLLSSNTEAPAEETKTETNEEIKTPEGMEWAKDFGIDQDILEDPSMKKFTDVKSLAKSYVHAQRMMGADKILVPNKYADDKEWADVYKKLGLPELDKYELKGPEGVEMDEKFMETFKEKAHALGVLPKQGQALMDWFTEYTNGAIEEENTRVENEGKQAVENLKKEWGLAFDSKVKAAQFIVNEVGGKELQDYFNETGYGNDPVLIKAFAAIGERFGEDKIKGSEIPQTRKTPDEIKKDINTILNDSAHPYNDRNHPNHGQAVKEVSELFNQVG